MQCSLPRLAANSISDLFAMFFVIAFWHPELSDRISLFLPIMLAYMLATDVSAIRWFLPVLQREWESTVEQSLDSVEKDAETEVDPDTEVDPETEEFRRMFRAAVVWLGRPLAIFVALLFLLPAYVLAVRVCLR
jgi:hypothetical protein